MDLLFVDNKKKNSHTHTIREETCHTRVATHVVLRRRCTNTCATASACTRTHTRQYSLFTHTDVHMPTTSLSPLPICTQANPLVSLFLLVICGTGCLFFTRVRRGNPLKQPSTLNASSQSLDAHPTHFNPSFPPG